MSKPCGTKSGSASNPPWASAKRRSFANSTRSCRVGPTTTETKPPSGPLKNWITSSAIKSGAGLNDDTPTNRPPGENKGTSSETKTVGLFASPSVWPAERAKCSNSIGWPAPRLNAISKSKGKPIPTMPPTPNTSRSVAASSGASGNQGQPTRTAPPWEVNLLVEGIAAKCHHQRHWLEGLEPYEGKLSSTVLRGGRAGNSPLPLVRRMGYVFAQHKLNNYLAERL